MDVNKASESRRVPMSDWYTVAKAPFERKP